MLLCRWVEASNTSLNGTGASWVAVTIALTRSVAMLNRSMDLDSGGGDEGIEGVLHFLFAFSQVGSRRCPTDWADRVEGRSGKGDEHGVFGEEPDSELGVLCGGAKSVALCEGVSRLGAVGISLQTEPEGDSPLLECRNSSCVGTVTDRFRMRFIGGGDSYGCQLFRAGPWTPGA